MPRPIAILAILALPALPSASYAQDEVVTSKLADPAASPGWVSLFDGKTMSGWTTAKPTPNSKWEVVDGAIVGSGQPSMLYSPKGDYKNFKYRAEVKINDKGNSGMYILSPKTGSFTDGYEIQINSTHGDPVRSGSIYTFVEVYETLVPPDTYFTQEVEAKTVNYRGKEVVEMTVKINDKVLYKFRDFDKNFTVGHFAFQQHDPGSKVSIRKVEVMELK